MYKWKEGTRALLSFRPLPLASELKHYECLISICAHDAPDFLLEQINNICKYVPDCVIILHINSDQMKLDENALPGNVWINPTAFHASHCRRPLWLGFLSNVELGYKVATFDRVMFISSSCIFFREVDWSKYPKNAVCTYSNKCNVSCPTGGWWWARGMRDARLVSWARENGGHIYGGWLSGTMLPEYLMKTLFMITDIHENHYDYNYPYEEMYPQTVANVYAAQSGAQVFRPMIWMDQTQHERYHLMQDSCFEEAVADDHRYGVCRVPHELDGPVMAKIRDLQSRCSGVN